MLKKIKILVFICSMGGKKWKGVSKNDTYFNFTVSMINFTVLFSLRNNPKEIANF